MKIGDRVRKLKGYAFTGKIIAIGTTDANLIRLMVEFQNEKGEYTGLLHIYAENNLQVIV